MKMPHNYTEDHNRRHSLTRRAHLAEQMGAPRKMHERIRLRAHQSTCQRRIRTRGSQVGPADPTGRPNLAGLRSRCISRRSSCQVALGVVERSSTLGMALYSICQYSIHNIELDHGCFTISIVYHTNTKMICSNGSIFLGADLNLTRCYK